MWFTTRMQVGRRHFRAAVNLDKYTTPWRPLSTVLTVDHFGRPVLDALWARGPVIELQPSFGYFKTAQVDRNKSTIAAETSEEMARSVRFGSALPAVILLSRYSIRLVFRKSFEIRQSNTRKLVGVAFSRFPVHAEMPFKHASPTVCILDGAVRG